MRMLASKGLAFALNFFCDHREVTVYGVRFDALAEEGMTHAEENDVHGKDMNISSKDCARKQESLNLVYRKKVVKK